MFTASLRYITATFQSVAMNLIPAVVFVLAVACRRERFLPCSARGQAKIWGVLVSTAGATLVVVSLSSSQDGDPSAGSGDGWFIGSLMVGLAVLSVAAASLFLVRAGILTFTGLKFCYFHRELRTWHEPSMSET